jgi:isohexenylglutaconyl-CoA hydratase
MTFATITAECADGVFAITLNRPAQRNAMSLAMVAELHAALEAALADSSARVILLRGAGGNFSAGGDIADMAQARGAPFTDERDPIAVMSEKFGRLCAAFAEASKPVLAILEGAVIGGGFGLACVADVAMAGASAKFRLSETTLGLIPAQIAPFLVARLGFSTANRLALTAAVLSGREAHGVGLVHEVADTDEALEGIIAATVKALKASPPGALAATKLLVRRAAREPAETLIGDAAALFAAAAWGAEAQEGMAAFLQKRAPSWAPSGAVG